MKKTSTLIWTIKLLVLFIGLQLFSLNSSAATFRTLIGILDQTPTVAEDRFWINSDTQFGEAAGVEISYTPAGGGATVYLKVIGTFDNAGLPGANWRVDVTYPAGATNAQYQLFNRNQSGTDYGFTGFTNAGLVLPVTFSDFSFNVKGNQVQLNWATTLEYNNAYFEIETSSDVITWKRVAKVSALGNTNAAQNYTCTDVAVDKGMYYYRLSQVDLNGKRIYYGTILKVLINTDLEVSVYPNPVSDHLKIIGLNETANVNIFNEVGAQKLSQKVTPIQNTILLKNISAGLYFVNIKTNTSNKVIQIFVR